VTVLAKLIADLIQMRVDPLGCDAQATTGRRGVLRRPV
jgi:hypothetical protein